MSGKEMHDKKIKEIKALLESGDYYTIIIKKDGHCAEVISNYDRTPYNTRGQDIMSVLRSLFSQGII